jgi:starch synthase
MKGGLLWADILATVSPTYSHEIQHKEFGNGLEGVLQYRSDDIYGVLDGIDSHLWDPESDPLIPQQYSLKRLKGKQACREALLQEFSLEGGAETPLIVMSSHLDHRKGADLLADSLEDMLNLDVNAIVMGTGQEKFHRLFHRVREKFPQKMGLRLEHDEKLQHQLLAGADLLLMPSRYEPWGGLQLCALKYGTIPIVCATGSLNDSVRDVVSGDAAADGTGFVLREITPEALLEAVRNAIEIYRDRKAWKALQYRAMREDLSWSVSAKEYEQLYIKAREKHSI